MNLQNLKKYEPIIGKFYILLGTFGLLLYIFLYKWTFFELIFIPVEYLPFKYYLIQGITLYFLNVVNFVIFIRMGIDLQKHLAVGRKALCVVSGLNCLILFVTNFQDQTSLFQEFSWRYSDRISMTWVSVVILFINVIFLIFPASVLWIDYRNRMSSEDTLRNFSKTKVESRHLKKIFSLYLVISGLFIGLGNVSLISSVSQSHFESTTYGDLYHTQPSSYSLSWIQENTSYYLCDNRGFLKGTSLIVSAYKQNESHYVEHYAIAHFKLNDDFNQVENTTIIALDYPRIVFPVGYNGTSYFFVDSIGDDYFLCAINSSGLQLNQTIAIPPEFFTRFPPGFDVRCDFIDLCDNTYNVVLKVDSSLPSGYYEWGFAYYVRYDATTLALLSVEQIFTAMAYHLDAQNIFWAICWEDFLGSNQDTSSYPYVSMAAYGYNYQNGKMGTLNKTILHWRSTCNGISPFNCHGISFVHFLGFFVENNQIFATIRGASYTQTERSLAAITRMEIEKSTLNTAFIPSSVLKLTTGILLLVTVFSEFRNFRQKALKNVDQIRKKNSQEIQHPPGENRL